MRFEKRWVYLFLFWLINFCLGSFYAWSVYSSWLSQHYSDVAQATITTASLTYIFSIGAALNPVAMITGGCLSDRFGPKIVLFAGGLMVALGYFLMAISDSPSLLLLGYGIALGMGSGACVIATVTTAVKLFPEMRGFAGGSVSAFYGVGSICLAPVANAFAEQMGISTTLIVFSVVCLILIWASAFIVNIKPTTAKVSTENSSDLNWLGMIKTARFWAMFVLFVVVTLSPLMLFSQTVTVAQAQIHLSLPVAVLSISVLACANTMARFLAGILSDRIGRVNTITIAVCLSLTGLGLLSLAGNGDQWLFFAGLICIGACFGSSVGVFPSYTAEQFGVSHTSMNYGVLALAFSVAGLIGPNIIQLTVTNGNYQTAYQAAMMISTLGLVAAYFCRRFELKTK